MQRYPQYFHFTLGPVQGFVAQARRTRDFWAGSFILSWLAGVAMESVEKQDQQNKIIFPIPDKKFLQALENGNRGPQQGSIPNRFKAGVSANFKPELVTETVNAAWQALAELVWNQDIKPLLANKPNQLTITKEIWERQINGFWEMSWAITDDNKTSNLLDRRKNWRTHLPPAEPGVKCMLMDGQQELSGLGWPDSKKLEAFWKPLQEQMQTDLRVSEQLSALAIIKRRFAKHFRKLNAKMPNGWTLKGWKVPTSVPSLAYIAAAPWLAQIVRLSKDNPNLQEQIWLFHKEAAKLTNSSHGEYSSTLQCVEKALTDTGQRTPQDRLWTVLDGDVFFETALDNKNIYPDQDQPQAQIVKQVLKAMRKTAGGIEPPSPFYAILLMDGDSLGSQMSQLAKQEPISNALNEFTQGVNGIVQKHSGFLVYAGGDDVLALLPIEYALSCAAAIRQHYLQCMQKNHVTSTISAAIEYAHIRSPFTRALKDAHPLLDDVAKDGRGRDAIACRVWKPGGLQQEWSMPWEQALVTDNNKVKVVIDQLAKEFTDKDMALANRFFYRIRERFMLLNPTQENAEPILNDAQAINLLAAEYINSGVHGKDAGKVPLKDAENIIRPLLEQCRTKTRVLDTRDNSITIEKDDALKADAALLVRFLASKGIERRD